MGKKENKNWLLEFFKKYYWLLIAFVCSAFINGRFPVSFSLSGFWTAGLRFVRQQQHYLDSALLFLAVFLGILVGCNGVAPGPYLVTILFSSIHGIVLIIPIIVDKLLIDSGFSEDVLVYSFPVFSTTSLHLFLMLSPFGAMVIPGSESGRNLLMVQVLSLFGLAGVFFLLAWIASFLVFQSTQQRQQSAFHSTLFVSVVAFLLVISHYRTLRNESENAPETNELVRLAGVLVDPWTIPSDVNQDEMPWEFIEAAFNETKHAANAGAKIIVYSEWGIVLQDCESNSNWFSSSSYSRFLRRAKDIAKESQIWFFPSFVVEHGCDNPIKEATNRLIAISPKGELVGDYSKAFPLKGNEYKIIKGSSEKKVMIIDTEYGRIAAVICADAGYPQYITQAGRAKADFLLVSGLDWPALYKAVTPSISFRAIENGMTLARITAWGRSMAVDPFGNVLMDANYFGYKKQIDVPCGTKRDRLCTRPFFITVDIPTHARVFTLYPWLFEIPGFACYFLSVVFLCLIIRRNSKSLASKN